MIKNIIKYVTVLWLMYCYVILKTGPMRENILPRTVFSSGFRSMLIISHNRG